MATSHVALPNTNWHADFIKNVVETLGFDRQKKWYKLLDYLNDSVEGKANSEHFAKVSKQLDTALSQMMNTLNSMILDNITPNPTNQAKAMLLQQHLQDLQAILVTLSELHKTRPVQLPVDTFKKEIRAVQLEMGVLQFELNIVLAAYDQNQLRKLNETYSKIKADMFPRHIEERSLPWNIDFGTKALLDFFDNDFEAFLKEGMNRIYKTNTIIDPIMADHNADRNAHLEPYLRIHNEKAAMWLMSLHMAYVSSFIAAEEGFLERCLKSKTGLMKDHGADIVSDKGLRPYLQALLVKKQLQQLLEKTQEIISHQLKNIKGWHEAKQKNDLNLLEERLDSKIVYITAAIRELDKFLAVKIERKELSADSVSAKAAVAKNGPGFNSPKSAGQAAAIDVPSLEVKRGHKT